MKSTRAVWITWLQVVLGLLFCYALALGIPLWRLGAVSR